MDDNSKIKESLKGDLRIKYQGLENFYETIQDDFQKLSEYKAFIENINFTTHWWDSYTKTKFYLKEKALTDNTMEEKLKESALYDWLKICINTQKDINCDFYFEKNNLHRETEVATILFDKDGKLRKIFKNPDWQIRLKTIADWFLRRYNGKMAIDILRSHQNFDCWDNLKLFYPRLLVAIIIGLLALITAQEGWNLPHKLADRIGYWGLDGVSIGFLAISILYLTYECYNIILDKKNAFLRALNVGLYGFGASLILSTLICYAIGPISGTEEVINPYTYCNLQSGLPVFKNIIFFASVALFIGIFMQVFWEKETITEPL